MRGRFIGMGTYVQYNVISMNGRFIPQTIEKTSKEAARIEFDGHLKKKSISVFQIFGYLT